MSSLSSTSSPSPPPGGSLRLIDIGANLLDSKFSGEYNGSSRHPPDLETVLRRSLTQYEGHAAEVGGCERVIITAGTLSEARETLAMCEKINAKCASKGVATTAGFHPTRATEYEEGLYEHVKENAWPQGDVVALGELGLDYDRLQFSDKESQMTSLLAQLAVSERLQSSGVSLPLFIHSRNCGDDLYEVLKDNRSKFPGGVVHSFDGPLALAEKYMSLGLYIGLNGCSFRTPENMSVVSQLPLDRLMLETDAPWCDIRPTHPGHAHVSTFFEPVKKEKKWEEGCFVKNRTEPCMVVQVLEVVAGCQGVKVEDVAEACFENSMKLFFP